MWLIIQKGGYLMYPIALCSILALGIFLERLWTYTRIKRETRELAHRVEPLVAKHHVDEAMTACHQNDTPQAAIFLAALRVAGRSRDQIKAIVMETGHREAAPLQRFLGLLGTIATISPLLGLLGTVLGMVLLTAAMALPVAAASRRFANFERNLARITGVVSIVLGVFLAYQIAFVDGLFLGTATWDPH